MGFLGACFFTESDKNNEESKIYQLMEKNNYESRRAWEYRIYGSIHRIKIDLTNLGNVFGETIKSGLIRDNAENVERKRVIK